LKVKNRSVYLYGVKDKTKACLVTISNQQFMLKDIDFISYIVYEDINNIAEKDRNRLLSASHKQFPDFEDFKLNAEKFFRQELAI